MLLVMVSHCANQHWLPGFLGHGVGGMGVVLFFTLSGFLMAYLYADLPFNRAGLMRYARHRIGRVIPLYVAVVLISFFLFRHVGPVWLFPIAGGHLLAQHLLFISGMRTLWTIPVEIQFYILFVAVWALVAAGRPRLALLLPLIGLAAAAIVILKRHALPADSLPFWGHFFLFGAAAGLLWRRHAATLARYAAAPLAPLFGWAAIALLVLAFPTFRTALHLPVFLEFADPLTAGAPVLFLGAALLALGPLKLLAGRVPRALGEVSYGAYLFHFPILMTLANLVPHASWQQGLLLCVTLAILTFAAAWLSFRFFERPMQRLFGFASTAANAHGSAG